MIENIKYYEIFSISGSINKNNRTTIGERPIVYVKSITTRNKKIPDDIFKENTVNLAFYRSTGTSRHDSIIKDFWFPTTKITSGDDVIINKLESIYVSKYESYKYKELSTDPAEVTEQDNILKYSRYINYINALVGYFLYINNDKINENTFSKVSYEYLKSHLGDLIYEMLIPSKPLITLLSEQIGGKINKKKTQTKIRKRKTQIKIRKRKTLNL